jgi:small ligand-binding sensory domain FIST
MLTELRVALPWLRRLVAGLSPRRPVLASRSAYVGFVVNKVALEQVFYEFFVFPLSI